jgi:hypothetical protein
MKLEVSTMVRDKSTRFQIEGREMIFKVSLENKIFSKIITNEPDRNYIVAIVLTIVLLFSPDIKICKILPTSGQILLSSHSK